MTRLEVPYRVVTMKEVVCHLDHSIVIDSIHLVDFIRTSGAANPYPAECRDRRSSGCVEQTQIYTLYSDRCPCTELASERHQSNTQVLGSVAFDNHMHNVTQPLYWSVSMLAVTCVCCWNW